MVSSTVITNSPDASGPGVSLRAQKLPPSEYNLVSTSMHVVNSNVKPDPKKQHICLTPTGPSTSSSLVAPYPSVKSASHTQASSSLFNYRNLDVYVVGNVGHPKAKVVRVVHISDTRGVCDSYTEGLPKGHILVHSGDFLDGPPVRNPLPSSNIHLLSKKRCLSPKDKFQKKPLVESWKPKLKVIDDFFQRQPHPYKVFVSGCWDYFDSDNEGRPSAREIQKHLPSAIYLEDAWCKILGLKIYGVPWTSADDLRPEDGKSHLNPSTAQHSFKHFLSRIAGSSRRRRCTPSTCTTDKMDGSGASSSIPNRATAWEETRSSSHSSLCDGFILTNIDAVSKRYAIVPEDTDILVSHMPAWRPELYSQVVNRIQPLLHLCGHDYSGYGVTWRRGVVFSNAALQLTSTHPQVMRRRKAYSSSYASVFPRNSSFNLPVTGTSAPSRSTEPSVPSNTGSDSKVIFDFPEHYREPYMIEQGVSRPRRWRRRLSNFLSQFSFLTPSCYELSHSRTQSKPVASFSSYSNLKQTPSSIAASTVPFQMGQSDEQFIYDSALSAFGRGMYSESSMDRRTPLVFDVYVVMEDDEVILPDYKSRDILQDPLDCSSSESVNHPPFHQHAACSLQ